MHLFSVLANEPTESRLIFNCMLGLKTSWVLSFLGDATPTVLLHITAGCSGSMNCRSCHPNSAVLQSTCQTIKWFAYVQLHISSLYFSLPFSASCKLNKIFSSSALWLYVHFWCLPWDGCCWWLQSQEWHVLHCWYNSLLAAKLYVFIHHWWSLGSHSPKAHNYKWNISPGHYAYEKESQPPGKLPPLQLQLKFKLNCN